MGYSFVDIDGPVRFFPYRTARVADIVATYQGPCVKETETELALAADVQPDNHTVYGLTIEEKPYYLFFTDEKAYGGLTLVEGRW